MRQKRQLWIKEIYDRVPETYRGINKNGEHVIQLHSSDTPTFATLERLSSETLEGLVNYLAGHESNQPITMSVR